MVKKSASLSLKSLLDRKHPVSPSPAHGFIDFVDQSEIGGWAKSGDASLPIHVYENGELIASGETGLWRPDLGNHSGFKLSLKTTDAATKLLNGNISVVVKGPTGNVTLDFFEGLKGWLIARRFVAEIPKIGLEPIRAVMENIQAYLVGGNRDYSVSRVLTDGPSEETTMVTLPVGLLSLDQEAVVGRNGNVFLIRGTNGLLQQYSDSEPNPAADHLAAKWFDLIKQRSVALKGSDIHFTQCIIPEKSSVLNDCFPVRIGSQTAIMKRLDGALRNDAELADEYLNAYGCLTDPDARSEAYQKLDTHLAPIGAYQVAKALWSKLGDSPFVQVEFSETISRGGDVGRRIASPYARASMRAPGGVEIERLGKGVETIDFSQAPSMIGTRVVYRNQLAPSRKKVVAFANSFFDRGIDPSHVSWWLARMFREYHFVWSPDFDLDYVQSCQPDVVICQTIERFLSRAANV